jgi:hypothetical protein
MAAKPVVWIDQVYPNYTINTKGRIFSKKAGKYLSEARCFRVFDENGKPVSIGTAQLMSNLFMNGKKVYNIDGNPNNNSLDNLTETPVNNRGRPVYKVRNDVVTEYKNINDAFENDKELKDVKRDTFLSWVKKGTKGWSYHLEEEPETEMKELPGFSKYKFYENGTVWSKHKKTKIAQEESNMGPVVWLLSDDDCANQTRVYIAEVMEQLFDIPNEYNEMSKPINIVMKNTEGVVLGEYTSIREAQSKNPGIARKTITASLREQKVVKLNKKKVVFEYKDKPVEEYKDTRKIQKNGKGVLKICPDGTEQIFTSQKLACEDAHIRSQQLLQLLRSGESYNGCFYKSLGKTTTETIVPAINNYHPVEVQEMYLDDDDTKSCTEYKNPRVKYGWYKVPGFDPSYEITPKGEIRYKKRVRSLNYDSGYGKLGIHTENGEKVKTGIHVLMAIAFIPNPFNLSDVNHIDGNPKNNTLDNLEWSTHPDNMTHAFNITGSKTRGRRVRKVVEGKEDVIFPTIKEAYTDAGVSNRIFRQHIDTDQIYRGAKWFYVDEYDTDVSGEYKVLDNFPMYRIYNNGKIWSQHFKRMLIQQKTTEGYMTIGLGDKRGINNTYRVHRLVAMAFLGASDVKADDETERDQVNHIDSNRSNNNVDNLEWVTPKENMKHAVEFGRLKKYCKKVVQMKDDEIIREFSSITKAAESVGVTKASLSYACNNETKCKGYYWKFVEN